MGLTDGRAKGSCVPGWALLPSAGGAIPLVCRKDCEGGSPGPPLSFPGPMAVPQAKVHLLIPGPPVPSLARMLVEKYSVSLQTIPPVHPGETVFLPRRHSLPCILDSSHLKPRSHLEGLFLR